MNDLSVAQNFFFKFFEKTLGGYYFFYYFCTRLADRYVGKRMFRILI